ncbi:MAG TPA: PH domain-containing protein [Gammaproteobacteria bacterium]|nr:PH domain-containing protein [Gammaproteobacteria bacterium]
MGEAAGFVPYEWHRLSAWSIVHFAQKAVVQNVSALIYAGGPATFGASQWGSTAFAWSVPIAILVFVLIGSMIAYVFFRYRIVGDSIQIKRGALFKKHLNLSFHRIQNVSIEHPFYFRPLGRVTLKIDSAGAAEEEVNVAALMRTQGEAARDYILRQKRKLDPAAGTDEHLEQEAAGSEEGTVFYRRSLSDLVVHGLTNNRSFILIAGVFGFLVQSGFSLADLAERLGIDFDVVIGGLSLVRLAMLVVFSFIAAVGIIALLSVVVSIVTYYGFSMSRTTDSLTIRRGLLTKHEIHVKKSRIQTITLRQDWLDRLLGRRNIILERITHSRGQNDPSALQKRRIFVPSARVHETPTVTDEILPGCRVEELSYTPISIRWLYKYSAIVSALYVAGLAAAVALPDSLSWTIAAVLVLWPLHVLLLYLSWKRGGLAIDHDVVVARSGTIGIDYRLFAADKIQDVTHIQSVLMRRHDLSSIKFHTASTAIKVPYMPTAFLQKVVDYCAFRVESTSRSWM